MKASDDFKRLCLDGSGWKEVRPGVWVHKTIGNGTISMLKGRPGVRGFVPKEWELNEAYNWETLGVWSNE